MTDFTKPTARLGGINGVCLQRHIEDMRPTARLNYTTPLYTLDQIISYLEDQPYPMTEHGASIRAIKELKKLGASAQNGRDSAADTTDNDRQAPLAETPKPA